MNRITPKLVREAELPPGRDQITIWDIELPGFGLRLTPGSKSYVVILPEECKSFREQRLPMSDYVHDLLKRRYDARTSDAVFPRRYVRNAKKYMSFVDRSHEIVRRETGCNFTLHDLRRTNLTTADRLGIPLTVMKAIANHAPSRDVTVSYIILDVERLREPVQRITDRLLELMNARKCPPTQQEILDRDVRGIQHRWDRAKKR